MKKAALYLYLCVLAGLTACSREECDVPSSADVSGIGISGSISTRAAMGTSADNYRPLTESYGTVYVRHTRNGELNIPDYKDAENKMSFKVSGGTLNPVKNEPQESDSGYRWYWDGSTTGHVFHAWTMPKDGHNDDWSYNDQGDPLVELDERGRFGTVNLSMEKQYERTEGDTVKGHLSNLEYFIGAVKGPVTLTDNGSTNVTLDFKHLVAKIIVAEIKHIDPDGAMQDVSGEIPFGMPNMPNKAYWTTGVPAGTQPDYNLTEVATHAPRLLALVQQEEEELDFGGYTYSMTDADYGVSGTLRKGWCFYIYPCRFDAGNTLSNKMGEIEFNFGSRWYYGTLESLTGVNELKAGECISLTLLLMDGNVQGLHPHIVDWNTNGSDVEHHDHPGIYNVDDWKKYIDWVNEYNASGEPKPAPPAGLLDENGNLNLYCDLDLRYEDSKYANPGSLKFQGNGKLKGNGHRVKTTTDWNDLKDELTDIYISADGKNTLYN